MIQKSNPRWERKEPWKFVPRRDLFPDAEMPAKSDKNKHIIKSSKQGTQIIKKGYLAEKSSVKPVKPWPKSLAAQPELLLLLFALIFLKSSSRTQLKVLDQPQSIQMLKSIGPYLDEREQNIVYTAAGIMEAAQLIRDIASHTYHHKNKAALLHVPSSPAARRIEALKAIKPYIAKENRKQLDRFLNFYEGVRKVQSNLSLYKDKKGISDEQGAAPLKKAGEFLELIHPVLPDEQRQRIDRVMQMIKMVEVMGNAEKAAHDKNKRNEEIKKEAANNNEQSEKIMDSLAPMLNEEQKESMNMIIKMAQLLSQPD